MEKNPMLSLSFNSLVTNLLCTITIKGMAPIHRILNNVKIYKFPIIFQSLDIYLDPATLIVTEHLLFRLVQLILEKLGKFYIYIHFTFNN